MGSLSEQIHCFQKVLPLSLKRIFLWLSSILAQTLWISPKVCWNPRRNPLGPDHNFHEWWKTFPDENFSSALPEHPNWENCWDVAWGKSSKKRNYRASIQIKIPFGKQQINFAICDCLLFHNIFMKSSRVLPLPWSGLREEQMLIQGEDVYSRRRCLFKVPNLFRAGKLNPWLGWSSELLLRIALFRGVSDVDPPECVPKWESHAWRNQSLALGLKLSKLKEKWAYKRDFAVFSMKFFTWLSINAIKKSPISWDMC